MTHQTEPFADLLQDVGVLIYSNKLPADPVRTLLDDKDQQEYADDDCRRGAVCEKIECDLQLHANAACAYKAQNH